jgi:lysophospholipase L1-like esterase
VHGIPLKRFLFLFVLGLAVALIPGSSATAQPAPGVFEKDILAFEAADRTNPPAQGSILLVGDSQFTRWKSVHEDLPDYRIINRGFGGSTMRDLLRYTDRIVLPYKPRMIVVNEGGNDIHAGRTPEQLLADITNFVGHVRQVLPDAPIVFDGLTPSPARWTETDTRRRFNQMLRGYFAGGKNLIYLDLFDAYLGNDGKPREQLFVEDKLHHSAAGYAVRTRILRPILGQPDFPDRKPAQ